MKILYAVYNISGYLLAELKALAEYAAITVIETPCKIDKGEMFQRITWIDRRTLDDLAFEKLVSLDFDVFICPGWCDKILVRLAAALRRKGTKTVLSIDTPWEGRFKQRLHCFLSRLYLIPKFNYAWGAGESQKEYLLRLGFKSNQIYLGTYCADTEKFSKIGKSRLMRIKSATDHFRKERTFLYIGRYVPVKNMRRMEKGFIDAYEQYKLKHGSDITFKLKCIGGGALWDERTMHSAIEHMGYKQPSELQAFVDDADCFVLPSLYEPWGVVVHEAALMALPMLCSDRIQAATRFLIDNGFRFSPFSTSEIADAFLKVMESTDERIAEMSERSYSLGMSYTTSDWANTVMGFVK